MNEFKGKTILVTGASGFIGTCLVERLVKYPGIRLVVLSRLPYLNTQYKNITNVVSPLEKLNIEIWKAAGVSSVDIVFHFAAFTPKSTKDANRISEIQISNIDGTLKLLESLPNTPEKIIFSSSLDVYAMSQSLKEIDEYNEINPETLYGASKYYCERLIRTYAQVQKCNYAILRFGHIFGPGEQSYNKLIPLTIKKIKDGNNPVIFGDGSYERDFLYVEDAVEATIRSALLPVKEIGPVNIVRGKSLPIRKIVEMIIDFSGGKQEIVFQPSQSAGYSLRFNNQLMKELLGEWDFISYEEGLKREIKSV